VILEVAILNVRPGEEANFEHALQSATPLIAASKGFHGIEVRPCVESTNRYLLLVRWNTVEDHEIDFRQSERYAQWRKLLHHFYDPFPTVEHYREPLPLAKSGSE
jgi:heme-degrading monooxygenase HmoA